MDAFEQRIYRQALNELRKVLMRHGRNVSSRSERDMAYALNELFEKLKHDGLISDFRVEIHGCGYPHWTFTARRPK